MIQILENDDDKIILRRYPIKNWLAFFCLTASIATLNYLVLFNAPVYSSLTCDRAWLNTIDCELLESSLFKSDLRHQTIKNIGEAQHILNNGRILLNTEIDLLHNQIKNNYFPSHSFLGFYDIYLYRFPRQALNEAKQIKNFVNNRKQNKLEITRKLFSLLYPFLLLLPVTILISIFCILAQPITTYIFNFKQNKLTIVEKSSFTSDRKSHSIDSLKITSTDEQKNSIMLTTNTKTSYLFDYFQNPKQASKAIDKLKQHIN